MREFAEQEIILPTGPYSGRRFKIDRQPWSASWFDALDSGKWRRAVATGPQQSGKTLCASIIPVMYHLFEVKETVLFGVPNLDMVADKWREDFMPAIAASKYRELMPDFGAGSRGGSVSRVEFKNGTTLRFMTSGGGDKARAGFTTRILCATEIDGMDESGGSSREADKLSQLEGRTRAHGDRARVYLECTVSHDEGATWVEYSNGTASKLIVPCPHCSAWITPEREHLVGWKGAENITDAGAKAAFCCPSCAALIDDEQRRAMNQKCKLVHKGQEVTPEGEITGKPSPTDTLGFRWNAYNNLLVSTSAIAQEEWRCSRSADEENSERKMRQFWWAVPVDSGGKAVSAVDVTAITRRVDESHPRGIVPTDAEFITIGIDLGLRLCHWTAIAWRPNATPHVIDYGRLEVPIDTMASEEAILLALRDFRDTAMKGWPHGTGVAVPAVVLLDAGNEWGDLVSKLCEETGRAWLPAKGFGTRQYRGGRSSHKKESPTKIVQVGDNFHIASVAGWRVPLVDIDADYWKTWLHSRLQTPEGKPGALTLFNGADHFTYAKHMTAEKKVEEFVAGKGAVTRWEAISRNNHYLDSTCLACVAGHIAGVRLIHETDPLRPEIAVEKSDTNFLTNHRGRW